MHIAGLELAELARGGDAPDQAAARIWLDEAAAVEAAASHRSAGHGLALQLRAVSKSYGARAVLRDISLQVEPGAFVALVGRSGCGKSTLLRLLAGLEQTDAGAVGLQDGTPLAARRDDIRIMFQDARLLPWKRVIDNVALGLPADGPRRRA